jgi:hypothetical protein
VLSSPLPSLMAGAGFLAMAVAMFAPLASNGDPASALRTTDLPVLTPLVGLVTLVVATAVLRGDPRLLRLGRAAAPLPGLLLSAAVGGEIFQWGARRCIVGGGEPTDQKVRGSSPFGRA